MTNAKLTQDELQAIKERVDKATPGPWISGDGVTKIVATVYRGCDVPFLLHSRQDIPKLVAEVERLQRRLDIIDDLMIDEFWHKVDDYYEVKPEHSATKDTIQEVTMIAAGAPITGEGDDD